MEVIPINCKASATSITQYGAARVDYIYKYEFLSNQPIFVPPVERPALYSRPAGAPKPYAQGVLSTIIPNQAL